MQNGDFTLSREMTSLVLAANIAYQQVTYVGKL